MRFMSFFDFPSQIAIFRTIGINDYVDILLITYIIYNVAKFFKNTRSIQVLKGIAVIILALQASEFLKLNTINFILRNAMQVGLVAVVVLFQPELRSGLSKMGRSRMIFFNFEEQ